MRSAFALGTPARQRKAFVGISVEVDWRFVDFERLGNRRVVVFFDNILVGKVVL